MPSLAYDVHFIQEAGKSLKDYLLADTLYWPISASPPPGERAFDKLTIGGLLLSLRRVEALGKSGDIAKARDQINRVTDHWKAAWERKIERETRTRIREWVRYLGRVNDSPEEEADYYQYEVRKRVILQLLSEHSDSITVTDEDQISITDHWLKNVLKESAFIWQAELASGFPEESYWFLYGILDVAIIKRKPGGDFTC